MCTTNLEQESPELNKNKVVTPPLPETAKLEGTKTLEKLNPDNHLLLELTQLRKEVNLHNQIRQALLTNPDLKRVFPLFVEIIAETFGFSLVNIYFLEQGELRLQANTGDRESPEVIPLHQGVHGRVARSGKAAFIPNLRSDPDNLPGEPEGQTMICVPLIGRGKEVLGTLGVEPVVTVGLNERDLEVCQSLAEDIVLAFEQSRLYHNEQRRAHQFALLNQIGRDLTATLDVETIIERVTGPIRRRLGYYSVNIGLVEGDHINFGLSLQDPAEFTGKLSLPLETVCLIFPPTNCNRWRMRKF